MKFLKPITTEYSYNFNVNKNIKIAHLSDLHCNEFGKDNSTLLNLVAVTCPDIILITGDIINKREPAIDSAKNLLAGLAKIAPCFYSLGNHEIRFKRNFPQLYKQFTDYIKSVGICLLDDESTLITVNNTDIEIAGFSANENAYKKFRKIPLIKDIPEPASKATLKLLLAHNPELYRSYELSNWDVIFSGHLHGGIIRLPILGGVISPSYRLFPKYSGGFYSLKNGSKMLVSRGLGMHTIKIRLWNPPELTVLNID